MAEQELGQAVTGQINQFQGIAEIISTSPSLQIALAILVVGLITIAIGYKKIGKVTMSHRFSYTRPHTARFVRIAILPLFAIALITGINGYIQLFDLDVDIESSSISNPAKELFAMILNSINILVIGYTVAHLVPIIITKREKRMLEREDFEGWRMMKGFKDDVDDLFHRLYKWVPPADPPEDIDKIEYEKNLETKEGRLILEKFSTSRGNSIGSFEKLVDDPYSEWKESERIKYVEYLEKCTSGDNLSGRKMSLDGDPEEIYRIDTWREEKRINDYEKIEAGARPPGYAKKKRQELPKSFKQLLPIGIFLAVAIGVASWWGIDLFVLATATGGMAVGVGFALQETMQNYFAYIIIRKDKIFVEGDRVKLESGYNGYVHKITPRVTYVRHGLNESIAIIPTRQLVNAQIINYSKNIKLVPAIVDVGVSYLNDPKQVASILVKIGTRAMTEIKDSKGKHLIIQKQCPNIKRNQASCGCDTIYTVDLNQPTVRFNAFNDSSLDFALWVYVRDYGSQFKVKSDLRLMIYEEFKKYDIRIPWPIRTVYQGDEKREAEEISSLNDEREKTMREFGIGDLGRGEGESE